MKDITSTSFGLIIAFLLPGVIGLFSLSFWVEGIRSLFTTFLTSESNVGLFLLVTLISIAFGLEISILRSILFEEIICRSDKLSPKDFVNLHKEEYLIAFRAAVDENYRYHQFWGGIFIVLPILYLGWLSNTETKPSLIGLFIFLLLDLITFWGSKKSYHNYTRRAKSILGGNDMPNGWDRVPGKSIPNSDKPVPQKPPQRPPEKPTPPKPSPTEPKK